jgi:hypothetical protein
MCVGTPAQIRGPDDPGLSSLDESRPARKNTPGDQSMRRTIQDLASSIDPNVKLEPEVEDVRWFRSLSPKCDISHATSLIAVVDDGG